MPKWVWGTHAGGPTGGFGAAPYGATTRVRYVPKSVWRADTGGGEEEGEEESKKGTHISVSLKRGPNTTEWLGTTVLKPVSGTFQDSCNLP
eukprot:8550996-Pyramimonas_sp.AAC.1